MFQEQTLHITSIIKHSPRGTEKNWVSVQLQNSEGYGVRDVEDELCLQGGQTPQ